MRRGQLSLLFGFTVVIALVRFLAYAGAMPAIEPSLAALVHYVAVQCLTFALAAFLIAALSRATATRAAQIALYAQAMLFLAAFVDLGLGRSLASYDATYAGIFGSPGAAVAAIAYGAVVAWGVRDASVGEPRAVRLQAVVALVAGIFAVSLVPAPWPRLLLQPLPWGEHLVLAVYFGLLAAVVGHATLRVANRDLHARLWREVRPVANVGFALLPLVGVVAAGRLDFLAGTAEPGLGPGIELPFAVGAVASGAALFVQARLVRSSAWSPFQAEAAAVAKSAALSTALLLGLGAFLAAGLAGSVLWLGRTRWHPVAFGLAAGLAVLVGDLTAPAYNFAAASAGPVSLLIAIDQTVAPSALGLACAAVVAVLATLGTWLTNRTSA